MTNDSSLDLPNVLLGYVTSIHPYRFTKASLPPENRLSFPALKLHPASEYFHNPPWPTLSAKSQFLIIVQLHAYLLQEVLISLKNITVSFSSLLSICTQARCLADGWRDGCVGRGTVRRPLNKRTLASPALNSCQVQITAVMRTLFLPTLPGQFLRTNYF